MSLGFSTWTRNWRISVSTKKQGHGISFCATWITLAVLLLWNVTASSGAACYVCSSLNDTYCPEFMNDYDDGIVPYVPCNTIYEGYYCVKTTGVTGGAIGISCYRCDESKDDEFICSDLLFAAPLVQCDEFGASYCVKTYNTYGGSLGTRRFCSSRDLGNYCEYIRRPGDPHEYRSCVYTCTGDGCNSSPKALFVSSPFVFILATSVLSLTVFYNLILPRLS